MDEIKTQGKEASQQFVAPNCQRCGREAEAGSTFCPHCGEELSSRKQSPKEVASSLQKANPWRRVMADFIDRWLPCPFFSYLFPLWVLVVIGYALLSDGLMGGKSVGKRLLGLRTICWDTLEPCDYVRSSLRNLPYALGQVAYTSLLLFPLAFAYDLLELLFVLFDAEGRRLGDRIGGTKVVRDRDLAQIGRE